MKSMVQKNLCVTLGYLWCGQKGIDERSSRAHEYSTWNRLSLKNYFTLRSSRSTHEALNFKDAWVTRRRELRWIKVLNILIQRLHLSFRWRALLSERQKSDSASIDVLARMYQIAYQISVTTSATSECMSNLWRSHVWWRLLALQGAPQKTIKTQTTAKLHQSTSYQEFHLTQPSYAPRRETPIHVAKEARPMIMTS